MMARIKILLLVLCSILTACSNSDLSDAEYVERARSFQESGDLRSAIIELKNALRVNADNAQARWILGIAYIEIQNWEAADKELSRARQLGVSEDALIVELVQAKVESGQHRDVIENISLNPSWPQPIQADVLALRAKSFYALKNPAEAEKMLQAAEARNADGIFVRQVKADRAIAMGEYELAAELLKSVVDQRPASYQAWLTLGRLQWHIGEGEEARRSFTYVVDNSPVPTLALLERGLLSLRDQDMAGAQADLEKVVKLAPTHPRVLFAQGLMALQYKKLGDAKGFFEESQKRYPESLETLLFLGIVNYELGSYAVAEDYLAKVLAQIPGHIRARLLQANVQLRGGKSKQAEATLAPVIAADPNNAAVLVLQGKILMEQRRDGDAVSLLRGAVGQQDAATIGGEEAVDSKESIQQAALQLPPADQAKVLLVIALNNEGLYVEAIEQVDAIAGAYPDDPLPDTLRGLVLMTKGDLVEAEAAYRQALAKDGTNPLAATHFGKLLQKNDASDTAMTLLAAALEKYPRHPLLLSEMAQLQLRSAQWEKAEANLRLLVRLLPQSSQAQLALARFYLLRENPQEALTVLRDAPNLAAESIQALLTTGQVHLQLNATSSAISQFEKLVSKYPKFAPGYYFLALGMEKLGKPNEVIRNLERALKLQPDMQPARLALARIQLASGDIEKARANYDQLVAAGDDSVDVNVLGGKIALKDRAYKVSEVRLRKAYEKSLSGSVALELVVAIEQTKGAEAAIDFLSAHAEAHPDDAPVRFALAQYYVLSNKWERAMPIYDGLLAKYPNDPLVLNNLAWILRQKNPERARILIEKALRLVPNSAVVADTKGALLLESGDFAGAIDVLEKAVSQNTGDVAIEIHLIEAYLGAGRNEQARLVLNTLLGKRPDLLGQSKIEGFKKQLGG